MSLVKRMCLVLLCAGSSSRFGEKKQLVKINGFPLFLHTLMRFSGIEFSHIVLVTQEGDVDFFRKTLRSFNGNLKENHKDDDQKWLEHHKDRISFIAGGLQRWSSSLKAIEHLKKIKSKSGEVETVIIHDGARPLLDANDLKLLLTKWSGILKRIDTNAKSMSGRKNNTESESENKKEHEIDFKKDCRGLVASYKLVDTIKKVEKINDDLFIKEHPNRSDYLSVATPQIFDFFALEKSYQNIESYIEKFQEPTDDAEVVGKYFSVALCLLNHPNPKLTYAQEFDTFAKALSR